MINENTLNDFQKASLTEIRSLNAHARLLINEAVICKNFDKDHLKAAALAAAADFLLTQADRLIKNAAIPTPETDAQ